MEYRVHQALECRRGVGESKGHDQALKETVASAEGGVFLVARSHAVEIEGAA